MTGAAGTAGGSGAGAAAWASPGTWRRLFRERPIIPLVGLLAILVVVLQLVTGGLTEGIVSTNWVGVTIRAAVPLAILGACQTLTMLTGGIDLSVGMVASAAAYILATQAGDQGVLVAVLIALAAGGVAGLVNGVGVGVFKVHPLIMTLGMSLVVLGLLTVYQITQVSAGVKVPEVIGTIGAGRVVEIFPNNLFVFIPIALIILVGLRQSGFGRLLFALGDNPVATRLSGVRAWQVLIALYVISGVLAAAAGILVAGLTKTATLSLVEGSVLPSVAAAVIGGTSIMGGRGGYAGTIVGALILTVLAALLTSLQMPEAVRQILFGAIIVVVAAAYTRVTDET